MLLNIILQIAKPIYKEKSGTGSRSGSGSAYFLLEAEAPEAVRVESEALEIDRFRITASLGYFKTFALRD
jgi:hypothetical protein